MVPIKTISFVHQVGFALVKVYTACILIYNNAV